MDGKKRKEKNFYQFDRTFFSFNEIYSLFEKLMKGNEKKEHTIKEHILFYYKF